MRNRAASQDEHDRIRDRAIMSLFRARRSRLQSISKDNLRIYEKISTQKSEYSSENRNQSHRSTQENSRRFDSKRLLPISISDTITNITNISKPISDVRSSKVSIL